MVDVLHTLPSSFLSHNELDNVRATQLVPLTGAEIPSAACLRWAEINGWQIVLTPQEAIGYLTNEVTPWMVLHPERTDHYYVLIMPGESIGSLATRVKVVFAVGEGA